MQAVIPTHPSVHHTDEAQKGHNSSLWLFHRLFGMTGEAITLVTSQLGAVTIPQVA